MMGKDEKMKVMKKYFKIVLNILLLIIIFIAILAIRSADYLLNVWGEIEFSTVIYQLSSPLRGTNEDTIKQYLHEALFSAIFIFIILVVLWTVFKLSKKLQLNITLRIGKNKFNTILKFVLSNKKRKIVECLIKTVTFVSIALLLWSKASAIDLFGYIKDVTNRSMIFEEEYVDPQNVNIQFEGKKKNLIHIYMESMETTYTERNKGGSKNQNYIPNLVELAEKNVSFSNSDKLGGFFSAYGTDWTMGALLGTTTGVPYKLPIGENSAGDYAKFLPGVISLGDILKKNGYENYFLCGSDAWFGGRTAYFRDHGDYTIYDYYVAVEEGIVAEDYFEFWGLEDQKLYEWSKLKITEIASKEENFNIAILTVDTHQAEGYVCELCDDKYEEQYANVISCSDRQLVNFVEWIQQQSWYQDTVIIVTGDHLSQNKTFFDDIDKEDRRIYNCFINTDLEVKNSTQNRQACSLDLFPTVLAAVGARIEGDRLGLGTNLFSARRTLAEEMGVEEFNSQIARYSKFYNENFIKNEKVEN